MQLFKVDKSWNTRNNTFPIIFIGDFHVGSPNCDYKLLKEHVSEIAELKNAIVFLMGDMAEWIVQGDKRYRCSQIDEQFWPDLEALPMAYLKYLEELLAPIAHLIEVVHDGNHENSMFPYMYPGAELCANLRKHAAKRIGAKEAQERLRYAPGEAYTKITWRWNGANSDYRTLMINTSHGWQAGRMPGAKHNNMASLFSWITADIIMRAHSHELFAVPGPPRESPNKQMTKLVETETVYGHTGSYLKTREVVERPSYAELKGYRPLRRGHVRVNAEMKPEGQTISPYVR